jgi:hypothetical protein
MKIYQTVQRWEGQGQTADKPAFNLLKESRLNIPWESAIEV